jgi:hypothetical protein
MSKIECDTGKAESEVKEPHPPCREEPKEGEFSPIL